MRLLSVDIGTGTQDILLYDSEKEVENSLIMVMPSPTRIVAEKIALATKAKKDIVLTGNLMGGGPSAKAVKNHLEKGFSVYATRKAALSLHDNLERVRQMGVVLVSEEEAGELCKSSVEIVMQDLDLEAIGKAFAAFGVSIPSNFAVAVQDHGESPEKSNRVFRFELLREFIKKGGKLEDFAYGPEDIPSPFTRIRAQAETLVKAGKAFPEVRAVFMDTGPAAIFGALEDLAALRPALVVNIGNGHTLGALVLENRITALFEHHTSRMEPEKLQDYLFRLAEGTLSFEEVFEDGGHGAFIIEAPSFENVRSVIVTGPKRGMLEKLSNTELNPEFAARLHFAAPFGSMMLSGCFGLLAGFADKYPDINKTYKPLSSRM